MAAYADPETERAALEALGYTEEWVRSGLLDRRLFVEQYERSQALIQSPRISLGQLERIAQSDPKLMRRHKLLIRRTYLTRRMEGGVTDELLQQVVEFQDAAIQTGLIRDSRLSRRQAELLARDGANPTIRENATAWVKDKNAWK